MGPDDSLSVLASLGAKQVKAAAENSVLEDSEAAAIKDTIVEMKKLVDKRSAEATGDISAVELKSLTALLGRATQTLQGKDVKSLDLTVKEIGDAVLRARARTYFWQYNPWRHLEILFWALAVTLVRLSLNTGNFLRKQRFHKHAISHHISLIVTVPILAVLIAFVVSLLDLSIALGDVSLQLDLDDIRISILVAALIGLTPWGAREFLSDLADNFFKKLRNLTGGQKT